MSREVINNRETFGVIRGKMNSNFEELYSRVITPAEYGAVGDGVADDGDALNLMFAAVRTLLTNTSSQPSALFYRAILVDGCNKVYRTTKSLNLTGMAGWALKIKNLSIWGACTGKAVVDLIGTRGYVLDGVTIFGDKTNRPSVGIQTARANAGDFCDNCAWRDLNIDGWFSVASVHDYGSETTQQTHCTIYNRDNTGRVGIYEGFNGTAMSSDYSTVMTGGTSFINKQFLNNDYRYLPSDENLAFITGFATGATTVVTMAGGHDFEVGDEVVFQFVGGILKVIEAQIATVTARTDTTITVNLDTTGWGTFTSGGIVVRRATKSPVFISRTEGFAMDDCYVVSYGQPPIEIGFPDSGLLQYDHIHFRNILFEGCGHTASFKFNTVAGSTIWGFTATTYNAPSLTLLSNETANNLAIFDGHVSSSFPLFDSNHNLANIPSRFALYGMKVFCTDFARVAAGTFAHFDGSVTSIGVGQTKLYIDNREVTYGANDSGGTGFRVLRVPN